ncbi:unnamed protein product [Absidia cylindrospora]
MSQSSIQNPSSLLKSPTTTTQPTLDSYFALSSAHFANESTKTSRTENFIKSMAVPSSASSPSPSRRPSVATHSMMAKRAASSVSEALHFKLSALAIHDGTSGLAPQSSLNSPYDTTNITTSPHLSPYPSSVNVSTASLSQVSESNWANRYEDFDIKEPIGYGSSAIVYGAVYLPMKKLVALKMIDLDMFERNQIDELRRETALMALSKHPNVLKVYGSFVNGSKLYIITPYLSFGSCLDIMKTSFKNGFEEITIATILKQALEGLIYLHKNGHIHRDVKAGNLLMDDQGTVLLADFGVSSSLSEKGDVRKTFVGTPCWMAPEVMEQDGYDFKADIWSFGITAYELAAGHAPFAKYPPMKVLKLTLSNAPPSLDLEKTEHKYSKLLKDMIDLCLQKNPEARPSAEKLLLHPFFKQAKKKDYLFKSILSQVSPIDQRPHRKIPQKRISIESTDHWDFDDTPRPDVTPTTTTTTLPPLSIDQQHGPTPPTLDKPMVMTTAPTPTSSQQTKRRITFGDVVVRGSSHTSASSSARSKPPSVDIPVYPATLPDVNNINPSTVAPPKKSRFLVEEIEHDDSTHSSNSALKSSLSDHTITDDITCTTPSKQQRYPGQVSDTEVDKSSETMLTTSSAKHLGSNAESLLSPISRVASYDNMCERKSRFEVQHSSPNSTATSLAAMESSQSMYAPINISRESSQSSLQPHSQKLGRFSVEKTSNNSSDNTTNTNDDSRKIGRFELTSRSSTSTTTSSSSDGSGALESTTTVFHRQQQQHLATSTGGAPSEPTVHTTLYPQLELLLKQTDAQKSLLQEMMVQWNAGSGLRSRAVSVSSDQQRQSTAGSQETVDQLQRLLTASKFERERLQNENDGLRRELERLKRNSSLSNTSSS